MTVYIIQKFFLIITWTVDVFNMHYKDIFVLTVALQNHVVVVSVIMQN